MFTMMNTKYLTKLQRYNKKAKRTMKLNNRSTMCKAPNPRPLKQGSMRISNETNEKILRNQPS